MNKYSVSNTFNATDLAPFHGDDDLGLRTDISQGGRGDDVEHPTDIAVDPLPRPSVPMTRARARAIEVEVTSLLFELFMHLDETWLLSQTGTLCVFRYIDNNHKAGRKAKSISRSEKTKK